jgi:hypothetical protein
MKTFRVESTRNLEVRQNAVIEVNAADAAEAEWRAREVLDAEAEAEDEHLWEDDDVLDESDAVVRSVVEVSEPREEVS